MISKQKETFNKLADKMTEKINGLDKKVNSDNLIYRYKSPAAHVKFDEFGNAFDLLDKTREGEISLADAKMIIPDLNQM